MKNINVISVIGFLSLFAISGCVVNQSKKTNSGKRHSSLSKQTKPKSSKRDRQRTSVNQHSKNTILVSNLGTNDKPIENKPATGVRVSSPKSKCNMKGQCVKLIQHKIITLWQYPRSYPKYKTILVLDLTHQGFITTIKLKRSSGVRAFDDSVIKAVRQAAPFTEITYLPAMDITEFSSIEMVFKR